MRKIDRKSVRLRQLAYEEIRSAIIEGCLAPYSPLWNPICRSGWG